MSIISCAEGYSNQWVKLVGIIGKKACMCIQVFAYEVTMPLLNDHHLMEKDVNSTPLN
jgi:hypothetical protein